MLIPWLVSHSQESTVAMKQGPEKKECLTREWDIEDYSVEGIQLELGVEEPVKFSYR